MIYVCKFFRYISARFQAPWFYPCPSGRARKQGWFMKPGIPGQDRYRSVPSGRWEMSFRPQCRLRSCPPSGERREKPRYYAGWLWKRRRPPESPCRLTDLVNILGSIWSPFLWLKIKKAGVEKIFRFRLLPGTYSVIWCVYEGSNPFRCFLHHSKTSRCDGAFLALRTRKNPGIPGFFRTCIIFGK